MKRGYILLAILVLASLVTLATLGCNTVSPNNGFEAVLVEKPLIFGHGGVDDTPVKTGLTFTAPTTSAIFVNMQPIAVTEDLKDLMSSDGVPLEFDPQLIVQVDDSVKLIKNFGEAWYPNNIQRQFQNYVRQSAKKYDSNETAIKSSAIEVIEQEVTKNLSDYIVATKIPVHVVRVTIGKANPPDLIKHQRVETAAQEQRVNTEAQRKLAEDSRKAAELSRAEADNAYRNQMGLSPDQFIQLERVKMQANACANPNSRCIFNDAKVPLILEGK